MYKSLLKYLSQEKIRFLLVGGFNTAFGYLLFASIQFTIGKSITFFGSLYLSHAIGSSIAFVLYRRFVFPVQGQLLKDFLKFQSVYLVPLISNTFLLPAIILIFNLNAYVAQAISMVILTVVSYFGHKYFSFNRPGDVSKQEATVNGE